MEGHDFSKRRSSGDGSRSDNSKTKEPLSETKDGKRLTDPVIEPAEEKAEKKKAVHVRKTLEDHASLDVGDKIEEASVSNHPPPARKSVVGGRDVEPEHKPLFRITNPDVTPLLNTKSPTDPDAQGDRKLSDSSQGKGGSLKKKKSTAPPIPQLAPLTENQEEGESDPSESIEQDGMNLTGDINLPEAKSVDNIEAKSPEIGAATLREKSQATILREKWNDISFEIRRTFDEPCRVYKLRGYHSEPNLSFPFYEKFDTKAPSSVGTSRKLSKAQKFVSCEDIVFTIGKEHPDLVRGVLSEIKLRAYAIDEKMKNSWRELVDLEKKRFSFFDELFAMGYVVDSLEVLSPPPKGEDGKPVTQGEYFIEADERHYRKKVDYGRVVFKTKHVYTGNFTDWYFQGPGRYSWQDGTVYQGEFSHGLMHGPGSIHWPDQCVYEGHFINGIRAGWGVYSTADGYTFAGEWLRGLPHGHGKMWYDPEDDDNDYYEGQWEKGLPQGIGTRQYATGDRYVGHWSRGMRNGYGIMIWLQERQVYKGDWLDGVPHGFGKHIWYLERSASNSFPTRHVYQGSWILGRREGIGKMIYPCGSIYEGRWKNGQRHGKGMFINPAGDILIGLFRAGSILGGSEVPLHAPTYECDFGGLTEWLTAKFSLKLEEGNADEERLHEITKQYLPYIRKLYRRAGEFSEKYGNHGLYPAYMKKGNSETIIGQHRHQDDSQRHLNNTETELHHRGYSRVDESEHMKGKMEKPESLDGVNPVTRFGLWLLLRDNDSLLDEVTMAYYDKIWCETPPLSFQTRHNPFEPVYLWQFLQCLVVAAVAYYVDIPRLRQQESHREDEQPGGEEAAISETTLRSGVSAAERRRSYLARHNRAVKGALNDGQYLVSNKKVGHHRKRKDSNQTAAVVVSDDKKHKKQHQSTAPVLAFQEPGDKERLSIIPGNDLNNKKKSSLSQNNDQEHPKPVSEKRQGSVAAKSKGKSKGHSIAYDVSTLAPVLGVGGQPTQNGTGATAKDASFTKRQSVAESGNETEEEYSSELPSRKSVIFHPETHTLHLGDDIPSGIHPITVSVSECFETFLSEKLLPCLKREPGANLPVVPQPLPALVDLYDAFKGIKNRDILRGTEFLRSALPHLLFPNPKDAIWWHRASEPLSHSVVLNELFELFRQKFPNAEEEPEIEVNWEDKLETEYLGAQAQNSETVIRLLNLCKENPTSEECQHSTTNGAAHASILVPQNLITELTREDSSEEFATLSDFVTDGHPFAEDELVPEPFLWADDYKCIPVPRKYQHFENISTHDVFSALQQLYPRLCTEEHEKDLHFDLIFCDWLWCTSLLAKASTEREFRDAWKVKSSDVRPITNPQSLGVYAHYIKQIQNNPYLSPNPPPGFQPKKRTPAEEPKVKQHRFSLSSNTTAFSKKSNIKNVNATQS